GSLDCFLEILLGIVLRHVGVSVAECSLRGFDAQRSPDRRRSEVPQLVRMPSLYLCLLGRTLDCTAVAVVRVLVAGLLLRGRLAIGAGAIAAALTGLA